MQIFQLKCSNNQEIPTPVEHRSAVQSATAHRAALSAELCALARNDTTFFMQSCDSARAPLCKGSCQKSFDF